MNTLAICPCCSNIMTHHFNNHREYWFCRECWQEMPNLADIQAKNQHSRNQIVNLSPSLIKLNKTVAV